MKYIEIHDWKEYKKKKDWLKATELLQDEMAYNIIRGYNTFLQEKIDTENPSRIYVACDYSFFEKKIDDKNINKLCNVSRKLNLWRIEYECCVENEEGVYNSEDFILCFKATLDIQKNLKRCLMRY